MERQKFYISKNSGLRDVELFVHFDLLIKVFRLVRKTLLNGLRNNRIGLTTLYTHVEYPDGAYLGYSSLPKNSLLRYKLPLDATAAYQLLKEREDCQELQFKDENQKIMYENLRKFYLDRWPMFINHYKDEFQSKAERQRYAQCHAVFSYIIDREKNGESLKNLCELFKKLAFEELPKGYKLVFSTQNYRSFVRKIREAKDIGIKNCLMHKSKGAKRMDLAILSEADLDWIRTKKADEHNYTYRTIQGLLIEERGIYVSAETLKKVLSGSLIKNLVKNFSMGASYVRKNRRPTMKREFHNPGDEFQADGSKLQFICINHIGKIISLMFFVVLDAYSKKVVGFSVDTSENSEMIMNAFKYAFIITGALPKKIVVDNSSCYDSKEMRKFRSNLQHYGVVWKFCAKDYPLEKAEVESFFSTFQKVICNKYPYYIGEGIKTSNKYGNPSMDLVKKYWKSKHLLKTQEELTEMLFKMIKEYNNEYYKEVVEPVNAVSRAVAGKHDSTGTLNGFNALLA